MDQAHLKLLRKLNYEINFDGVVFTKEERANNGVVVRDDQGMVIASMSQNIAMPLSVVEVEVVAAVRALEFSLEIRISLYSN